MLQTTNPESVTPQGIAVLNDSALNKGTAFTTLERKRYGIEGLLPHSAETIERQVLRVLGHLSAKATDLERYIYLIGLEERNETLFYRTVMSDPARFLPILYDPTVAEACLKFGHIFRRARGMYLDRTMKGRIAEDWRAHPWAWRHRRQRNGHPDRQVAALHSMRGDSASPFAARAL